jgi:hypothetical protein
MMMATSTSMRLLHDEDVDTTTMDTTTMDDVIVA